MYIDALRKKGQCDIQYRVPPELMESCGIKEKVIKFETHKDLDDFVNMVHKKAPTYFVLDEKGKDDVSE